MGLYQFEFEFYNPLQHRKAPNCALPALGGYGYLLGLMTS